MRQQQKVDFQKCYARLGLPVDAEWSDVRRAFKSLAHTHHPDRFHHPDDKEKAQQTFLEINEAYQHLNAYYRTYKELPKRRMEADTLKVNYTPLKKESFLHDISPHLKIKPPPKWQNNAFLGLVIFAVFFTLILFIWYLFAFNHTEHHVVSVRDVQSIRLESYQRDQENLTPPTVSTVNSTPIVDIDNLNASNSFTFGDTLNHVLSIQGTPTDIKGNIWHYGESKIIFLEGRVYNWETSSSYPLNTRLK